MGNKETAPGDGAKKGRGLLAKLGWGFLALFALLIVIGALNSEKQAPATANAADEPAQPAVDPEPTEPEPAEDQQRTAASGERFTLGDFAYVVEGAKRANAVGNRMVREEAPKGASILIVSFSIENLGKETATALSDDFEIVDAQGRTFKAASKVNTTLAMSGKKEMMLSQLQPGLPSDGLTGFIVPDSALDGPLRLRVPEKGFLGSDSVEVPLDVTDQ